ncbi:TPA: hypothetical protein HA344_00475 [Candidatus Bathyarchaeota archaeon]|nr:hypothetical protein [Candidatus Bathyarchaeota archaeon]
MSSSQVSEGIVLIGIVVAASMLSQVFITTMTNIQRSSVETSKYLSDRIKTSVKVVYAVNTTTGLKLWVKNVGSTSIGEGELRMANVFFGRELTCYTYAASGVGWNYTLLNGAAAWTPNATLEVTLTPSSVPDEGQYYLSFITHNGVKSEYSISIGG